MGGAGVVSSRGIGTKAGGPLLCTSISAPRLEGMAKKAAAAFEFGSDLVEFRLDTLASSELGRLNTAKIREFGRSCILTLRPRAEGGKFAGRERDRLVLFERAVEAFSPAYVDIELSAAKLRRGWVDSIRAATVRIVSSHDYRGTSSTRELEKIRDEALQFGSIAKVVTMATRPEDNVSTLSLYSSTIKEGDRSDASRGLIAFCMGRDGVVSRVLSMALGAPLCYAALPGEIVAPGQLSIRTMLALRELVKR